MSNLVKIENELDNSFKESSAKGIMLFCRAVVPHFYKNLSNADMAAEKKAIELLTGHISDRVMKKMCELAVINYGIARSENNKVFFDINYILTFYTKARDWCYFNPTAEELEERFKQLSDEEL